MKTNMKELDMNDMEMVNGGFDLKLFALEAGIIICFGPVGEIGVGLKHLKDLIK